MTYKRIAIVEDESGHTYIIPYERMNAFYWDLDLMGEDEDDYDLQAKFEDEYSEYRIGGDPNQEELYQKIQD